MLFFQGQAQARGDVPLKLHCHPVASACLGNTEPPELPSPVEGFLFMEAALEFLLGVGGLIVTGFVIAFAAGWYILASRAKKLHETT